MSKLRLFLLVMVAMSAVGCFRTAGEGEEVPIVQDAPVIPTNTPFEPLATPTEDIAGPPITVVASPTVPVTPIPATPTDIPPVGDVGPAGAGDSAGAQGFVTPGGSTSPITIIPPSPTPDLFSTATPSGLITPTSDFGAADGQQSDECVHIVQTGDNLFRIAINNNVTLDDIRAANPQIQGDLIQPGDRITIPGCVPSGVVATSIPGSNTTSVVTPVGESAGGVVHVVVAGDTLFTIAQQYGVTMQAIIDANSLTNPDALSIGQELTIP